jgi:teichuronic acid biosynthesis glycosyltransferase TuaG
MISSDKSIENIRSKDLVSIVIPVYNAEAYLIDTLKTIQNQTYSNWEAIFVDDCSSDNSVKIIKKYQTKDARIKLFKNKINSYTAITRNKGIDKALGRYIAYLDADDLWDPTKLQKQIAFMKQNKCAFMFTGYEFADEYGKPNGKKVNVPESIGYRQALKNTTIWTSTVMLDSLILSKDQMYMPNVRRGQDTATWWNILKSIEYAHGLNEILAYYRRSPGSLSSNKLIALKRTWSLYRNIEKLNIASSCYNFIWYSYNAVSRRL